VLLSLSWLKQSGLGGITTRAGVAGVSGRPRIALRKHPSATRRAAVVSPRGAMDRARPLRRTGAQWADLRRLPRHGGPLAGAERDCTRAARASPLGRARCARFRARVRQRGRRFLSARCAKSGRFLALDGARGRAKSMSTRGLAPETFFTKRRVGPPSAGSCAASALPRRIAENRPSLCTRLVACYNRRPSESLG